jgi:YfiH family protein
MKPPDELAISRTEGIRWLSLFPRKYFPFIFHGLIVKDDDFVENADAKEIKRLLQKITGQKRRIISLSQMHRDGCVVVTSKDEPRGRYEGDAILTDRNDVFICVSVADCLPIFLLEEKRGVIGLVHAGWRGTLLGITRRILDAAKNKLNCDPSCFTAAFGPCIRSCCYQVRDDVAILFDDECVSYSQKEESNLDLADLNLKQLADGGVKRNKIIASNSCTCCEEELFYSYRREKENAGRMIGFMGLR